ncbi:MAG: hypothetical protein AB7G17_14340 [Phycisphaerales bacterium]
MATEVSVEEPRRLALVARVLKDIDKAQSKGLSRGLRRVTTKLEQDALREGGRRPPRSGGLAARVAAAQMSTVPIHGGLSVRAEGVNNMHQLAGINAGWVRHPVFGNPNVWVAQRVTPGWFTDPMEAGRDEVTRAMGGLLDDVAANAARKIGT